MTYVSYARLDACVPIDLTPRARIGLAQTIAAHIVPGACVLALSALIGGGLLFLNPPAQKAELVADASTSAEAPLAPVKTIAAAEAELAAQTVLPVKAKLAAKRLPLPTPPELPARAYVSVLDPSYTHGLSAVPLARSAPLRTAFAPAPMVPPPAPANSPVIPAAEPAPVTVANLEPVPAASVETAEAVVPEIEAAPAVEAIPLPMPRPAELRTPTAPALPTAVRAAQQRAARVAQTEPAAAPFAPPAAAPAAPGFFEKMFGSIGKPSALAYAAPEDGVLGGISRITGGRSQPYAKATAVYDITNHTVFLPDGTKLEAHSGLGPAKDNPTSVNLRMRGATPPAVYELTEREALFHGVRALRLTPVGGGDTYGRGGLLAHTFMLGPNGDSNGCVVFRNYNAFLAAYLRGDIKHLMVVSSL